MRPGPINGGAMLSLWAAHLAQTTQRAAAHSSSPTDQPVSAPDPIRGDITLRRPSRYTFDIRV